MDKLDVLSKITTKDNHRTVINNMMEYIKKKNRPQVSYNELELKLYIIVFMNNLKDKNTSVHDAVNQKEFHKWIARPLANFIDDFTRYLNDNAQYQIMTDHGLSTDHPRLVSDKKNKDDLAILLNIIIKDPIESSMLFGQAWSFEKVKKELIAMYNQFKNNYYYERS